MDRETAMALFDDLEGMRVAATEEDEEEGTTLRWKEVPFNVRLDAGSVEGLDPSQGNPAPYVKRRRTWRIFVTWSGTSWTSGDRNEDWEDVIRFVTARGATFRPENNGLAID
ncbi:MAG: hypothetical protein ACRDPE_19720 [Solirubrobacterales bacterium]